MEKDEVPAEIAEMILRLKADVEVLRYVVRILCGVTLPPALLDRLVEALDTPIVTEDPGTTKLVHDALGRFIDELEKDRRGER